MNRSMLAAALIALGAFAISGCNSPESLCKKMMELSEKEAEKQKDAKKPSEEETKKAMENCVKEAKETKEKDPAHYDCIAECVGKDSWEAYRDCSKGCKKSDDKK